MSATTMTAIPVVLIGTTPLLCGKPSEPLPHQTPHTQAFARLYQDEAGRAVMPANNLFRCLVSAGHLLGRNPATLKQALGIATLMIPIHSRSTWQVDSRSVRKPGSQERMICHRPRFDDWSLAFDLQVDEDLLDPATAAVLVATAGQRMGLGDFRAERGGPFGRFRVGHWGGLP